MTDISGMGIPIHFLVNEDGVGVDLLQNFDCIIHHSGVRSIEFGIVSLIVVHQTGNSSQRLGLGSIITSQSLNALFPNFGNALRYLSKRESAIK